MTDALVDAVGAAVGTAIVEARRVGGGDVNDGWRMVAADGRALFVKHRVGAPVGMYRAEAGGLRWLAEARALPVPDVVAVLDGDSDLGGDAGRRALVLEWVETGAAAGDFEERLGRGLAALHASGAPAFGLDGDNFIGPLPQQNAACPTWPEFYATRRLEPLVRRGADAGLLDGGLVRGFGALATQLGELCGPSERPARLHGDLWRGNVHVGPVGEPWLIDPGVYGGHREVDLAMMRLFGGFGARCFAAYEEAWPLAPGHSERVALYQLYPLLVHVLLFGGSYVGSLRSALGRYVPVR